ncbi:C45 family autoproteolytic acyltransferase/hydolase [Microbacterium dextranolyticum]|uniref:Peptidase C45 hydrolase domain-containing protein n=1 Tax=Microbacterium dextranolyticum TaxID=36806 RepID=A0A9W6HMR0_9MICO|nr:C45 family peptidase [Microbacterium dextranolyticum]MBM7464250.1 hypothetical protein [Microbacterium dextranolyticum]GLJ95244.1 hypothetical protein GCM10017591_13060 [Microbacterium dextranolyticum]
MSVVIERRDAVSGMGWTVLRGARADVMRALGAEHAALIEAQRADSDGGWSANVRRSRGVAAERFAAVADSTRAALPVESQELDWIAEGADIAPDELWAQNLRGDLGRDGTGCSDLSLLHGASVVLGHNEDGDAGLRGLLRLVTLDIEGDPSITVVWYPGMLPSNSFVTTSAGLSFGMDHVPVRVADLRGCGRHLVARHAQRQHSGAQARDALTRFGCAGGFAFDVADAEAGRVDLIENAAGVRAMQEGGVIRHTNHLRVVDGARGDLAVAADDEWLAESRARLAVLSDVSRNAADADAVWGALRADGVRNLRDDLFTLATAMVDTGADLVTVQAEGEPWRGSLGAFARGERVDA